MKKIIFCSLFLGLIFNFLQAQIYTPNGTIVETFTFSAGDIALFEAQAAGWLADHNLTNSVQRVGAATREYNCHSFAWNISEGGSNVWVNAFLNSDYNSFNPYNFNNTPPLPKNISRYWDDGSYIQVDNESMANKVWYGSCWVWTGYGWSDNCDHSAVRLSNGLYKSKWGAWPLYIHAYNDCPYTWSNRKYYIKRPRISGPSTICDQATYTIDNFPAGATVQWSMSPDFLSPSFIEQSANTILMINHYGKDGIGMQGILNALITIGSQQISVSKPVLSGWAVASIEKSRLEVRPGEYILEANTTQNENPYVTTTWTMSGPSGALVDFPYPEDASYTDKAGRLKVLEVYEPGYYTVCCRAYDGMYTTREYCSTFYVEDYKGNSPYFTLHPNPASDGSVSIRLAEEASLLESNQLKPQALTSSVPYTIQLWNSFGLIRQVTADMTSYQLDLTGVPPGFYYVHVIKDGLTYRKQLMVQ